MQFDDGLGRRQNYPSSIDRSSQPSSQPQPFQPNTQALLAIQYLLSNGVDPPKPASMTTNDGLDMTRRSDPGESPNEPALSSTVSQTRRSRTSIPQDSRTVVGRHRAGGSRPSRVLVTVGRYSMMAKTGRARIIGLTPTTMLTVMMRTRRAMAMATTAGRGRRRGRG